MIILNNEYKAFLLLLDGGYNIPKDMLTESKKDQLVQMELIELTSNGWTLTKKGKEAISNPVKVVYAMHDHNGNTGSYDNVLNSMSLNAREALLCSIINKKDYFKNINIKIIRVFIQHLLDININKKWGQKLNTKVLTRCIESKKFFDNKNVKNKNKKR